MATKPSTTAPLDEQLARILGASLEQVRSAGLGAFSLAEQEASKLLRVVNAVNHIVQNGTRKTVKKNIDMASTAAATLFKPASNAVAKLEEFIEHRVARVLNSMQIPTAADVQALADRVEALNQAVERLAAAVGDDAAGGRAAGSRAGASKKKTTRKKAPRKKRASKRAPVIRES